jgi:NADPH2:quinone reductase
MWCVLPRLASPQVLDMVAGDFLARDVACLADDGRIVVIAVQGGTAATIDCAAVLRRRLTITGATLRVRPVAFKRAIAAGLHARVWPLLETRAVVPLVHRVFPADRAADAHRELELNEHVGKLVLTWAD